MNSSRTILNINHSTSLLDDSCTREMYMKTNDRIFQHTFVPSVHPNQSLGGREQYIQNTQVRGVLESRNPDGKGQHINMNTTLRNGIMTHDGHRSQLDTRLFPGAPLMARGQSELKNTDLNTRLIHGQETRTQKSQSSLNDVSIDNFIPLIPCIQENVQNTKHIIPEYWVRGGMSTRSVIRNIDYIKSCGGKQ